MGFINQVKELRESDTPLLFFQCVLPSGDTEYWCTHSITFNGNAYSARVIRHNLFDLQLASDDAMDGLSQLSIALANADSALSELNAAIGFKGSQLTVYFAFADLPTGTVTTESTVLFRGVAGDPDSITEAECAITFSNKLSLQRVPIPQTRIQRTCPWNFPATLAQRTEAVDGGSLGRFSRFYNCGYSADVPGGVGNLNSGQPFGSCDKSRANCIQRGMFDHDAAVHVTRRFGGFEFVPSATNVRTAGQKASHVSPLLSNSSKFNDPVPVVYGTGWLKAPVIFSRNDGNLTHMEVLLGAGAIKGPLKVIVNDVEIPLSVVGQDMSVTGWYGVVASGARLGNFNLDFTDALGNPLGDPYGSLSVLSVVVPNRICSGRSLADVEVLVQGIAVDTYNLNGSFEETTSSNNPAWIILDVLQRAGWAIADLDLASFANAAQFCQQLITTTDSNGNTIQLSRYECNLILTKLQSAASVVRGIRTASSLMLRYGVSGLLQLLPETTISAQQPTLPDGSNSTNTLNGGWPAYEFSDASAPFSGIVRNGDGSSSVRLVSRSIAESSNRLSVEFQDEANEYQQDSLSIVNAEDSALIGYEISSQSMALGIANFNQATRVLLRQLDKSTAGNLFIELTTSFRGFKIRPGDIIAVTYLKEGFERTPFRVTRLSPSVNYQTVKILAQIHNDDWYSDSPAVLMNAGRQPSSIINIPRPLIGLAPHDDAGGNLEYFDYGISEQIQSASDGSATDIFTVSFSQPRSPSTSIPNLPLVSLSPQIAVTGGVLVGGNSCYYAVSAVDATGNEGPLSFTIPVSLPNGTNTNSVTITGLSFPQSAQGFHVYRGITPQELYRITASVQTIASQFIDAGAAAMPIGPPDSSFDHANFYYRQEYAGPFTADTYSPLTIGWSNMGAVPLAYTGMLVRIIEGTGRNQERLISTNNAATLTVSPAWSVIPDNTSEFVVVDGSWKFAAVTSTSPARFEIPYRQGTAIHILGRAANVNNQEADAELSTLTRWYLGGGKTDVGIPAAPSFVLTAPGAGQLQLSQIDFADLSNAFSITSGTLQLFYWNELLTPGTSSLNTAIGLTDTVIQIANATTTFTAGSLLQVESELITVVAAASGGGYQVLRGSFGSTATAHAAGATSMPLNSATVVVPFAPGFFENRASQNFQHSFSLPDARVVAATLYMTNSFGDGLASEVSYLSTNQNGLRTLSGGQFTIQVSGFVATQQSASTPVTIGASHAVRDIRAAVLQSATGYTTIIDVLQNGTVYCTLEIDAGNTNANSIIDGTWLAPFGEGATVTLNVTLNPVPGFSGPAVPARDLTVTVRM